MGLEKRHIFPFWEQESPLISTNEDEISLLQNALQSGTSHKKFSRAGLKTLVVYILDYGSDTRLGRECQKL